MTNQEKWEKLSARLDEIAVYQRTLGKLQYDMECCAPEEGIAPAGEDMSVLGRQLYKLTHAKAYTQLLCQLHQDSEGLSPVQKKAVELLYEDYARSKNISAKLAYEVDCVGNRAYGDWLAAKKADDFSLFRDSFAELVRNTRRLIDLRDRKYDSYYHACLDDTEKGGTEAQMDAFFSALKERIVPLLRRIQ